MENMEAQPKPPVGPRTEQQISHTNPIEENRRPTDKLFIYFFLVIVIAWLIACSSGFSVNQDQHNMHDRVDKIQDFVKSELGVDIYTSPPRFSSHTMIQLLVCTVLCLFCIFLSGIFTKYIIYFGIVSFAMYTILGILSFPYKISDFLFLPTSIISIISMICIRKADKSVLLDLFEKSYRIYNPLIIPFAYLTSILELSIFLFTARALISYVCYSNDGESYFIYNCVIMLFGGTSVLYSVRNFAVMVISDYTVNTYWENPSIKQSLARTFSNHMGTVIFSSIPFAPFLCTLVQALKYKGSVKNDEDILLCYASKLSLVFDASCTALTFSSIYGIGFIQSTQKMFDSLLDHSLLYLATVGAVEALIYVNEIVIDIFCILQISSFQKFVIIRKEFPECINWYIVTIFLKPLLHSVKALLVNKIIILNKKKQDTERHTEVLDHFQSE